MDQGADGDSREGRDAPMPPRPFGEEDSSAMVAFAQAEHARRYRDQVVTQLELGVIDLPGLFDLDRDDERVGSIKAVFLLQALPGIGKVASRKALELLGLDENIRIAELGGDARRALIDALPHPPSA